MKSNCKYTTNAGIYKLTCKINGKIYIGKAVNIHNRLVRHRYSSENPQGKSCFENSMIKYGWDAFDVEILETVENFDKLKDNTPLLERESYYINLYKSTNKDVGYNICKYSTDRTGMKHSEETKEKMRQPRSEITKEKMRQANLGKKLSEDTKKKISESSSGRTFTEEHKENLRLASPKRVFSVESKLKMSLANLGKKRSDESREKMRQAKLARKDNSNII